MRSAWTSYVERRLFSTYIISNTSMTLYIGITNNLARRVSEHKQGVGSQFTSRYHFDRLV
jgi:putative endonuclease